MMAHLAEIVVQAIGDSGWHNGGFTMGGPDDYPMREIAELPFQALGRPAKVHSIPPWLLHGAAARTRSFHPTAADIAVSSSP